MTNTNGAEKNKPCTEKEGEGPGTSNAIQPAVSTAITGDWKPDKGSALEKVCNSLDRVCKLNEEWGVELNRGLSLPAPCCSKEAIGGI